MHRLLRHLEDVGSDVAPRLLGIDVKGREILSFQHGEVFTAFRPRDWSAAQITAAARLLRRLHDATAGMPVEGGEETVCHNDFSDQAAPGPRARVLAYAPWLWLLDADTVRPLDHQPVLLRTFLGVYGFEDEDRRGFGGRIVARVEAERDMHDRAGRVTRCLRRPGRRLRARGPARLGLVARAARSRGGAGRRRWRSPPRHRLRAMAAQHSRNEASAAGSSQARPVTDTPVAAPRSVGWRPSPSPDAVGRGRSAVAVQQAAVPQGPFGRGPQRDPGQADAGHVPARPLPPRARGQADLISDAWRDAAGDGCRG
ncbi:hypothetical protein [Streptomyces sp. NRRL WC-3725]|uniref:hypothetical protein n=1 Tax=Streptomyces sp. NRRL WC-3725 TaxID=1463933 RepID=UPI00068C5696|nr:hypothetical protein [Streptomyces sp. NRRL WC-3725]